MPPQGSGPPYRHPSSTSVGTHPGTPRLSKALGPQVHIDIAPLNPKALGLQGPCRHPSSKGVGHAPSTLPKLWPPHGPTKQKIFLRQAKSTKRKRRHATTTHAMQVRAPQQQQQQQQHRQQNVMPICAHHKARHRAAPICVVSLLLCKTMLLSYDLR